jgi:hypothetical protein
MKICFQLLIFRVIQFLNLLKANPKNNEKLEKTPPKSRLDLVMFEPLERATVRAMPPPPLSAAAPAALPASAAPPSPNPTPPLCNTLIFPKEIIFYNIYT